MQKAVEINSRNLILRGMLHIPDKVEGKVPIVIIYHGFCGNKMGPHFMFVKLSRALEKLGIASARFDFAGSGESDGKFENMTFNKEVFDANKILDYVKELKFVDKSRIAILGFSMGGAIASVIAGERNEEINTLCLWAPAGNMEEIILSDNYIGNEYDEFIKKGTFSVEGLSLGKEFVDDIKTANIFSKAAKYDGRTLIVHGTKDEIVPMDTSRHYIEIYGKNSDLKFIDGANHMFEKNIWEKEIIYITQKYFYEKLIGKENYSEKLA
ncbi:MULTISPECIES: alpha/beta hydrolase [Clostridium]|uniref:alpha/beta hydrolase n=1 Tax=Clostridium TaxID=1485 RepID=UPI000824337E|nr:MULTISPECIES: alpha/beta fold hydrolase [Clostridium]